MKIARAGERWCITWPNDPVDARVYTKLSAWIRESHDYSALGASKRAEYDKVRTTVNREFGANVTLDQAISLRNIILKDKVIKNYNRMNMHIARIALKYADGESIVVLSRAHDFPPLNLLRGILLLKYEPKAIYDIFANRVPPADLEDRDREQYALAFDHDAESTFNQQLAAKVAADNELRVIEFFRATGIQLLTQDDLSAQQIQEFGRAVITPDVLFLDVVEINGKRVNWIDYKDYLGTGVSFLHRSNTAQAAKYTQKWGRGAMCFHRGYVEGLLIGDAALLDARALPVKLKQ